ncbi:MAG: cytochrome c biogenesis protein CcdA [Hyphomicrobiaceae bacterium]|nr:cytochrome c biogenesis protein CcdA [Hyphomicrobiaceae bacterium]
MAVESSVSLIGAFGGGILSFLSPCVLPLVPPYLAYMAGVTLDEYRGDGAASVQRRVLVAALAFVAGFSTVFVALGASASLIGQFVREWSVVLSWVAGIAIIAMGLHFLGVFRIALLYREARVHVERSSPGPAGAYVMGLAFAFGWTPCIGPVLAAVLTLAGGSDTVGQGALMLAVYSAGLGIPFILAAQFAGPFMGLMKRFRAAMPTVERIMGVALVVTGVMFLTGHMTLIGTWLLDTFPALQSLG